LGQKPANLYQKLPILAILGTVSPHFKRHNDEIWHKGADLGLTLHVKFCIKKSLKGYTLFGQIYTKNYQFRRFWRP